MNEPTPHGPTAREILHRKMTRRPLGISGRIAKAFLESKLTPLLVVASLLLGAFALLVTPREEEPQIKVPMIDVFVALPGATAEEVERRIVSPVEKALYQIPNVEFVYSTSQPSGGIVIVRFMVGTDPDQAVVRVHAKLAELAPALPPGALPPVVAPRGIDDVPVAAYTLFSKDASPMQLRQIADEVKAEFTRHPRVAQVISNRAKMVAGEMPLDWGAAETLAYASLLDDGVAVRISGQDSGRGTFFHRHAVLHDQNTGRRFVPLQHVRDGQPRFTVIDSVLSEEAVVGFEYGYATTSPDCLVVWEAQFGDFVNGAQVVIDQFISSGEAKWGRLCGLTLFLPHGYEGQGPEHSSARLERFLQLCAEDNMQVVVPSTPAQMFHLLRRQVLQPFRRPLITFTPKSLLRHELSVSSLAELSHDSFANVIGEIDDIPAAQVERVVFCSGKVYFDLLKARRSGALRSVALVRIEQLYPFPVEAYQAVLARYANATDLVWCQEEPQNQGAWYQIRHRLQDLAGPRTVYYAGRAAAAAPATGQSRNHELEQRRLVDTALNAVSIEQTMRNTPRLTLTPAGTVAPAPERSPTPISSAIRKSS